MKICFPSVGEELSSALDPRFGRCAYFLIVDPEKKEKIEAVQNQGVQANRGADISAAQLVVDRKVDAVIIGSIGPKAYYLLSEAGIKCYRSDAPTVEEALEIYNKGELEELAQPAPGQLDSK